MHRLATTLSLFLLGTLPISVIGAGESESAAEQTMDPAFSMTVMDAFKVSGKGVAITGRIDSGTVRTGDSVCLTAAKIGTKALTVNAIQLGQKMSDSAEQGDIVGILVGGIDKGDITRRGSDTLTARCAR